MGGIIISAKNGQTVEKVLLERPFTNTDNYPLTCIPRGQPIGYDNHFTKPEEIILKYDCSFKFDEGNHLQ